MAGPVASFGLDLWTALTQLGLLKGAAGSFVSPLSVFVALVLVLNGADLDSQTHQQLWAALTSAPAPSTPSAAAESSFNKATSRLLSELAAQSGKGTELVVANALWTKGVPVAADYAARMNRFFKAPVKEVSSAGPINTWAANVTRGLIPRAVPDDLDFSMVLTNAVYFLGGWDWPFNTSSTQADALFTNAQGAPVQVQMMKQAWIPGARVKFADGSVPGRQAMFTEQSQFRGVKLPYRGSNVSAIALLPNRDLFGLDADKALTQLDLSKLLNASSWQPSNKATPSLAVSLPRFNVSVSMLSVKPALRQMGVTAMFDAPDFGRLSRVPQGVSDVLHSVVVKVNEMGTKAAAVTAVVMRTSVPPRDRKPTAPFVFDRPFIFLVVDEGSRPRQAWTPLFIGTVRDPAESSS